MEFLVGAGGEVHIVQILNILLNLGNPVEQSLYLGFFEFFLFALAEERGAFLGSLGVFDSVTLRFQFRKVTGKDAQIPLKLL